LNPYKTVVSHLKPKTLAKANSEDIDDVTYLLMYHPESYWMAKQRVLLFGGGQI